MVDVRQLVAGSVIVHRFALPGELNVTVPDGVPGNPDSASIAHQPWAMAVDDEPFTVMVNDVALGRHRLNHRRSQCS